MTVGSNVKMTVELAPDARQSRGHRPPKEARRILGMKLTWGGRTVASAPPGPNATVSPARLARSIP